MIMLSCNNVSKSFGVETIFSICFLDATSGTTPPNFLCISIWVDMMLASTSLPFLVMAQAVSSQLLSIAKVIISLTY